jgi:hypothetical protein
MNHGEQKVTLTKIPVTVEQAVAHPNAVSQPALTCCAWSANAFNLIPNTMINLAPTRQVLR